MKRINILLIGLAFSLSWPLLKAMEPEASSIPAQAVNLTAVERVRFWHLPAEIVLEIAYESLDPKKPIKSLERLKVVQELTPHQFLNDEFFMQAALNRLFPFEVMWDMLREGTVIGATSSTHSFDSLVKAVQIVSTWAGYKWLAYIVHRHPWIRHRIKAVLIDGIVSNIGIRKTNKLYATVPGVQIMDLLEVMAGNYRLLEAMLELQIYHPDDLIMKLENGNLVTAYQYAHHEGDVEIAQLLLKHGANPAKIITRADLPSGPTVEEVD